MLRNARGDAVLRLLPEERLGKIEQIKARWI
jgi:hypothetical protein